MLFDKKKKKNRGASVDVFFLPRWLVFLQNCQHASVGNVGSAFVMIFLLNCADFSMTHFRLRFSKMFLV